MRALIASAGLALALATIAPVIAAAPSPDRAAHTVSDYIRNGTLRDQVWHECINDRTYENYPDCKNVTVANTVVSAPPMPSDSSDFMTQPKTYEKDAITRRQTLSRCFDPGWVVRSPKAWCNAAVQAQKAAGPNGQ